MPSGHGNKLGGGAIGALTGGWERRWIGGRGTQGASSSSDFLGRTRREKSTTIKDADGGLLARLPDGDELLGALDFSERKPDERWLKRQTEWWFGRGHEGLFEKTPVTGKSEIH